MKNLIHKILKESQKEWFDDIKPMEVYIPWIHEAIKGFEEWYGNAYSEGDDIYLVIYELKKNPTKNVVENAISVIESYKGEVYQELDDFDWALDYLKMSIDPNSWNRFKIFDDNSRVVRGYPHKAYQNEALQDVYINDESNYCLVTEDEEWVLLRGRIGMHSVLIPTLLKTENLNVNSLSSCYLINDTMLNSNWRNFRRAERVFLKDGMNGPSTTVNNNFILKVVKFKDGIILDKPIDTSKFFE